MKCRVRVILVPSGSREVLEGLESEAFLVPAPGNVSPQPPPYPPLSLLDGPPTCRLFAFSYNCIVGILKRHVWVVFIPTLEVVHGNDWVN